MKKTVRLVLAGCCILISIALLLGFQHVNNEIETLQETGIVSGGRNRVLLYDEATEILYVGTQEGTLTAFHDTEILWSAPPAVGAYSKLLLSADGETLYAANEGQRIYAYNAKKGTPLLEINVQRVVTGIAVREDEQRIAAATNTGKNKSNLIVYDADGTELYNTAMASTTLRCIEYGEEDDILLLGNKKGVISIIRENGEVLSNYAGEYDVRQIKRHGDQFLVLTADGTCHMLSGIGQLASKVTIDNTVQADVTCIAVDASGELICVGTAEGYLFVLDKNGKQLFMEKISSGMTDMLFVEEKLYLTGISGIIQAMPLRTILSGDQNKLLKTMLPIGSALFLLTGLIFFCIGIPSVQRMLKRQMRLIWRGRVAYLCLLPTFVLLFFFSYRGIFIGLTRAFTNWSKTNNTLARMEFVGFDNFVAIFREGYFLTGLKNLLIITATSLIKVVTVPLLVAWLLYSLHGDRKKYACRFLFVLPMVVPGVVGVMMWQRIYDSYGLLNNLLRVTGLESWCRSWLADPKLAIWAVVFTGFPFISTLPMLIYYGALGNIGEEITESALIDGANRHRIFWSIQLPLIRPQLRLVLMLTFIGAMQDYGTIYILTGGGPGTSTYVPALELYFNVSQFGRYAYASAMGMVLMLFTLLATFVFRYAKRREETA